MKTERQPLHPSTHSPAGEDPSLQHLLLELAQVDLLLQREVARWQAAGQDPEDDFRGLYISDAVAQALLELPFGATWGDAVDPESQENNLAGQAAENASRLASTAREQGQELRLEHLVSVFGLDSFERDALLICLAPALDLRYERIYGYLQDDVTRRRPSTNLILNLLCGKGVARLLALRHFMDDAPLVKNHLLERVPDGNTGKTSLLSQIFQVDETLLSWLVGSYQPHPLIREHVSFTSQYNRAADSVLSGEPGRALLASGTVRPIKAQDTLLVFHGPDLAAQEACARLLAESQGRPLLTLELSSITAGDEDPFPAAAMALRDARLTNALLLLKSWDACLADGAPPPRLLALLAEFPGQVIISGMSAWLPKNTLRAANIHWLQFSYPRYKQRQALWDYFLTEGSSGELEPADPALDTEALAGRFLLTSGQIRDAAATARENALQDQTAMQNAHLLAAARAHSNPRLASLARKIDPRYTWRDIILPADQLSLLKEIITTVQHRPQVLDDWGVGEKLVSSQGVTVLFAGPPGTGKTMAAEIIAAELGLDLYKIDLSSVVSKYIGETEKNLERIFSEATSSNAILFFDEADALFGKRSEVRDSHDRYANIETSYLLQRMEAYDGVTILATNLRTNLDEAFTRRLQFSVDFPFPDEADRLRIWQALFPPGVPHEADLDFRALAQRYKLAGGNIRNILVSAAYLASADGGQVTMSHLLHSTRRELQKIGRLVNVEEM